MSSRNSFASILMAGLLLAVGLLGLAPAAQAAPPGMSVVKPGESAGRHVIEIRQRRRGPRARAPQIPQPRGPAYIYYDYPYYYSRGHYPTHIVRYVYYPPYASRARYRGRCLKGNPRCVTSRDYRRGSGSPRRARRN